MQSFVSYVGPSAYHETVDASIHTVDASIHKIIKESWHSFAEDFSLNCLNIMSNLFWATQIKNLWYEIALDHIVASQR